MKAHEDQMVESVIDLRLEEKRSVFESSEKQTVFVASEDTVFKEKP